MFNLLTEQAKKNAAAEYRFRFWVVVCVFVCAEILLAFAGGTLSFISLRAEGKRIASDTAAQERARDARAGSALISSVQETGARVAVLAEHIPVSLSYGIATFVSLRQSEVRILA
ncbi:MAG: hypothetical protein Q8R17_00865, partial [bacterium]|nr:hypothetical protein [bacterium]